MVVVVVVVMIVYCTNGDSSNFFFSFCMHKHITHYIVNNRQFFFHLQ